MTRIYAPNTGYTTDHGVDFINGAAAVLDADIETIEWFQNNGFEIVAGSSVLSPWDRLTVEELNRFAPYASINTAGMTKGQIVTAIETALITLMNYEITAFDAITDLDGGSVATPTYANAAAVQAVLPAVVYATLAPGIVAAVPVTVWVDTDIYDKTTAGSYTFTATLGALPTPYANTAAVTAEIEVVVAA